MKSKQKNIIFTFMAVAGSSLIGLLFGEGFLRLYHAFEDKKFQSPQEIIYSKVNRAQFTGDPDMDLNGKHCRWTEMFKSHPYLMYVKKSSGECADKNINRQGFRGPEYPLSRPKKTFTIMVTGGSVAEDQMGMEKVTILEEELNKHYEIDGFENFKVLVGAMAGWRQPNQWIMMSLYGSILHGYISLDGMNELELIQNPNQRMAGWPSDPFVMNGISDVLDARKVLYARCDGAIFKHQLKSSFLNQFYLYFHITDLARRFCRMQSQQLLTGSGYMEQFTFYENFTALEQQREYNEKKFLEYIRNTSQLAKLHKIKEAYFIQPSPAYKKFITSEEKVVVGDLSYKNLYDKLIQDRMALNKENIPVINLAALFENENKPIFIDYVHLNQMGKNNLHRKMLDVLEKLWGLKKKNEK